MEQALQQAPDHTFAEWKQRQLVILLTRQLAEAQFVRADPVRTRRLWQEVAALDLDPERIIHLLYGVADHSDSEEMMTMDRGWRPSAPSRQGAWAAPGLGRFMGRGRGGAHRSARQEAKPVCR